MQVTASSVGTANKPRCIFPRWGFAMRRRHAGLKALTAPTDPARCSPCYGIPSSALRNTFGDKANIEADDSVWAAACARVSRFPASTGSWTRSTRPSPSTGPSPHHDKQTLNIKASIPVRRAAPHLPKPPTPNTPAPPPRPSTPARAGWPEHTGPPAHTSTESSQSTQIRVDCEDFVGK